MFVVAQEYGIVLLASRSPVSTDQLFSAMHCVFAINVSSPASLKCIWSSDIVWSSYLASYMVISVGPVTWKYQLVTNY